MHDPPQPLPSPAAFYIIVMAHLALRAFVSAAACTATAIAQLPQASLSTEPSKCNRIDASTQILVAMAAAAAAFCNINIYKVRQRSRKNDATLAHELHTLALEITHHMRSIS
jgi:hypothetical protein